MPANARRRVSRTGGRIGVGETFILPLLNSHERDGQSRKMPRRGAVTEEKYRVTQDSRNTLPSNIGPFYVSAAALAEFLSAKGEQKRS